MLQEHADYHVRQLAQHKRLPITEVIAEAERTVMQSMFYGAAALAAPLRANTTLKQLGLAHNGIGRMGMARLNEALSAREGGGNETLLQLPDIELQH